MAGPDRPKLSLGYHLAEALFNLGYSQGGPIYRTLSKSRHVYRIARAMLKGRKSEEIAQRLADLKGASSYLKKVYEPSLDIEPMPTEKRIVFEMKLDEFQDDLLELIGDYDLVDTKILSDVYNMQWRKNQNKE
ncbi:MAG: hypothetical protein WC683_15710 [bacterium]